MSVWGVGIYQNDTAADIKSHYLSLLSKGLSDEAAFQELLDLGIAEDCDDGSLFWMALADTQWKNGRLTDTVKNRALTAIAEEKTDELFASFGEKALVRRKTVLEELKNKLTSEQPERKIIRAKKAYICDWDDGDVYALKLTSRTAEEYHVSNRYLMFHKIGEYTWNDFSSPNHVNAVVRIKITSNDLLPSSIEEMDRLEYVQTGQRYYLPDEHKEAYKNLKTSDERKLYYKSNRRIDPVFVAKTCTTSKRQVPKELTFLGNYQTIRAPEKEYVEEPKNAPMLLMNKLEATALYYYLRYNKEIDNEKLVF